MTLREELETTFCFVLGMLIFLPVMIMCLPGHPWHEGTYAHAIVKTVYWTCGAGVLLIIVKYQSLKSNIIGTIMAVAFGPMTLLSIGFIGALRKIRSRA